MLSVLNVSPQNYNEMFLIEFEEVNLEANSIKKAILEWDLYVTSVLSLLVLVAIISVSIELIPVIVLCAHPLEKREQTSYCKNQTWQMVIVLVNPARMRRVELRHFMELLRIGAALTLLSLYVVNEH